MTVALRRVSAICSATSNCVLEAANEYYHPTQSDLVQNPQRFFTVARRSVSGTIWSLDVSGNPAVTWRRGWRGTKVMAERRGVQVLELQR